jgi:type VI secretion system protein ImpG
MKIDAEFPRFTQHLSEIVYPHFLAPTPSMAVVQLQPDLSQPGLNAGLRHPARQRHAQRAGQGRQHRLRIPQRPRMTLWPVELARGQLLHPCGSIAGVDAALPPQVKAGLRLRLRTTNGAPFNTLALDS